jgi:hypothetical protein
LSEEKNANMLGKDLRVNGGWKLRLKFVMKKLVDGIPKLARIR